jgi:aspartyl/asparaginyl beta-hydroxylase (cupin superfamily)
VADNKIHMKKDQWYEINNQLPHEVDNPTEIERIHLIIDILPDEMLYFDQGDK